MQQRIDDLKAALRSDPTDSGAMDELRAACAEEGDWDDLYAFCGDLAERVHDAQEGAALWRVLLQAVSAHLASTSDPILAAELHARAGDLLFDRLDDPAGGFEHYRLGFERFPDARWVARAGARAVGTEFEPFRVRLLEEQARLTSDEDARAAIAAELGRLRGRREDVADSAGAPDVGPDDDTLVDERPAAEEPTAIGVLLAGAAEEEASAAEAVAAGWAVADRLRSERRWKELAAHLEEWLDRAVEPGVRQRLARELGLLWHEQLKNPTRAFGYLETAYSLGAGDDRVRELVVEQYTAKERWSDLEQAYEAARKATEDRDQERRFLLERARVLWQKMDDFEGAERIYRRLRAHATMAAEALDFYEAYYARESDWRKLYTTLAQRQAEAEGEERVAIGVRMARVADQRMDNPDKAIEAWKRVLTWSPEHEDAQRELPALYERTGKWHALLEFLNARVSRVDAGAGALGRVDDAAVREERTEILRRIVDIYADPDKLGVPEMVIHTYNRILQVHPGDTAAQEALCQRYEEAGRWSELVGVLKRMADATDDPAERVALLKRTAFLWRDRIRNPGRAVEPFEEVLTEDPGDREALDALREIYRQKRSVDELYAVDRRALEVASDEERVGLLRELAAIASEKLHRYEDAISDWEALLVLEPGDDAAMQALQKLYARSGAWDRYVDLLNGQLGSVETPDARIDLLARLGQISFDKLRDFDRAKDVFLELQVVAPNHPLARTYLQKIHIMQQSWEELEHLYKDSQDWRSYIAVLNDHQERESDPQIKIQLNLQIAHLYEEHLGDELRALKRYERARTIDPNNLDVARMLAERYRARRDWSRLSEVFETIAKGSDDPGEVRQIQQQLVDLATQMKKPSQAFEWSAKGLAFDLQAERVEALERIEAMAEAAGTWDKLAALLDDLVDDVESESVRLAVLRSLGAIYKDRLHMHDRAIRVYQAAGELMPGDPVVLSALEDLYVATSDFEGLEGVFRQRAEASDSFEVIRENTLKLAQMYEDILADADQAIACYQRVLDSDASDRAALLGLKRVYEREERWEDLVSVIEQELVGADDPTERAALHVQLGRLQETWLEQVEAAIEAYRTALDLVPAHAGALEALEALFLADEWKGAVAPILEPIYRSAARWGDLAMVLEARLDATLVPEEQVESLRELASLYEERLQDPGRAYAAWRRLFVLSSGVSDVWDELSRLADVIGVWDDVVGLYAAALRFEPGMADGAESVAPLDDPHDEHEMTARLARAYEEKLDDADRAKAAWRAVLVAEPEDSGALESLERLHEASGEWDELLEILDRQAELAWDTGRKKGFLLRMSEILRDRLARPEDAIDVFLRILELDESNREVMEKLDELFRAHERWDDLAALLKRRMSYAAGDDEAAAMRLDLATVQRDRLDDVDAALDGFEGVLGHPARGAEARAALEALFHDGGRVGHATYAPRIAAVLEPIYREAGDWASLLSLLDVRSALAPDDEERAQVLRAIGVILEEREGDDQRALESYGRGVRLAPDDARLAEDLERVAERLGAWDAYVAVLDEVIDQGGEGAAVPVLRKAARIHDERLGDSADAKRLYEALLELEPTDGVALAALDRLYLADGDAKKRARVLRQRAEIVADLDEQRALWFAIGELERDRDELESAIEAFTYVVERSPDKQSELAVEAYGQLELLYEVTERWDALIRMMLERYEYSDDLEERKTYLYRAAMTYEERQEAPEDAIALYVRALDLDPRDDVARAALRRLYEDTERWSEFEALLTEELSFTDDAALRAELLLRLGLLYEEQMEDPGRALGAYRDLVEIDPEGDVGVEALRRLLADPDYGFEASTLLAEAFRRSGRDRELADLYALQLERFGEQIDVLDTLFARARLQEEGFGEPDGAFDSYAAAFRQDHHSERAWEALVRLARARDRWEELFALVEDVLPDVFDATDRTALRLRVAALLREERQAFDQAEQIYWQILDDEPEHSESLDALEAIYVAAERWDRFAEVLERKIEATIEIEDRLALQKRLGRLRHEQLGQPEEAAAAFEDLLSLEPTDAEAYERLEAIYAAREDWDATVDLLERKVAVLIDTDAMVQALKSLARVQYMEREERDTAIDVLARLVDLAPNDGDAIGMLEAIHAEGYARERVGEILEPIFLQQRAWPKLVTLYRGYLEEDGLDDVGRFDRLRTILRIQMDELDDPQAAFETVSQMLVLMPEDEGLHEQAAALCARLENWGELVEAYRGLLAGDLDDGLFIALSLRLARIEEEQLDSPAVAVEQYGRVLARVEDHTESIAALERLLTASEDWKALVGLYDHVAAHTMETDKAVDSHMKAATLLRDRLGDPERAADALRKVIDFDPENRRAYVAAEELHRATGDQESLEALYRTWLHVLAVPEERADVQLRLARLLIEERGDVTEGMDLFRDLFVLVPRHAEALAYLEGRLEDVPTDETAEALRRELVEVLEPVYDDGTPPERWVALYMVQLEFTEEMERRSEILRRIGDIYLTRSEDQHAAFEFYGQAFALDFGNEALEGDLKRLAAEGGYWDELLTLYAEGMEMSPDDYVVDRYLLECARIAQDQLVDPARAASFYQRVLERDPGNEEALRALETHFAASDRPKELVEVLRQKLDTAIGDASRHETMLRLADLLHDVLGEDEEAESVYRDVLSEVPDQAHAQQKLEEIAIARGDWEALVDLYQSMLRVVADDKAAIDLLSRTAQVFETQLERFDDAVQCYNDIFQYAPDSLYAVTSLERLYQRIEEWDGLLQVLRRKRGLTDQLEARAAIDFQSGVLLLEKVGAKSEAVVAFERALDVLHDHEGAIAALEGLLADPDYCLEAARILRPVFERHQAWARMLPLFDIQAELEDDPAARARLREQAATLQVEKLGDVEAAFVSLGKALADQSDDRGLRDRLTTLAEQHDAWTHLATTLEEVRAAADEPTQRRSLDLWLGRLYEEKVENVDASIHHYEGVLEVDEFHHDALDALDRLLQGEERWEDLADVLQRKIQADSGEHSLALKFRLAWLRESQLADAANALELYREVLWEQPDHEDAIQRVEAIAREVPDLQEAAVGVLEPLYRQQERWRALTALLRVRADSLPSGPERATLQVTIAELFDNRLEDVQNAFEFYGQALAGSEDVEEIVRELVRITEAHGMWPRLAVSLEEALARAESESTRLDLQMRLGSIYMTRLGQESKASGHLKAVLAADPENVEALRLLEEAHETAGNLDELVRVCAARAKLPIDVEERKRLYRKIASVSEMRNDDDAALAAYESILELDPSDAETLERLEGMHERREDFPALIDVLERRAGQATAPSEIAALKVRVGEIHEVYLEEVERAVDDYEGALELQPEHPDALEALERLYGRLERWELMRDVLQRRARVVAEPQARAEILLRAAVLSERELGDARTAVALYHEVLAADERNAEAIAELVRLLEADERWPELAEMLERQKGVTGDDDERRGIEVRIAGLLEARFSDFDGAMERLQGVLVEAPEHVPALMALGRLRESLEEWTEAVALYEKLLPAVSLDEERVVLLRKLGRVALEELDEPQRARGFLQQARQLDDEDPEVLRLLAAAYRASGSTEALRETLERAFAVTPDASARVEQALELARLALDPFDDPIARVRWLEAAYELEPENGEVLEGLVQHFEAKGDDARVAELLGRLLTARVARRDLSNLAVMAHRLGEVRERLGDGEGAVEAYRLCRQHDAGNVENLLALGRLLYERKDHPEALKVLQALLLQQNRLSQEQMTDLFLELTEICVADGDDKRALQYVGRLLRLDPEHARGCELKAQLKK